MIHEIKEMLWSRDDTLIKQAMYLLMALELEAEIEMEFQIFRE